MEKDSYYRLEYSDVQGCFHFEDPKKNNKNTNNYYCLCDEMIESICKDFTHRMYEKYPSIGSDGNYPSFETIKKEFDLFLLS